MGLPLALRKNSGRIVVEDFESTTLRDNPLGDPARRAIPVYLPPDYDEGDRRYPVVYWLHGFTSAGLSQINYHPWVPSVAESMNDAIQDGAPPAILVMADGSTKYGGSLYLNSSATGRYEDAIKELVKYVDSRFRTLPSREFRAINGKSDGGYGALVLAMRNPELFGAVACHSAPVYFESNYKPHFWNAASTIASCGGVSNFLKMVETVPKKGEDIVRVLATVLTRAMVFSPNPHSPDGFDLPFDLETGEINEVVWNLWLRWDPVVMLEPHSNSLRSMRLVYFECGTKDQWNSYHGNRVLHRRMERLDVAHEYQEFEDDDVVDYRIIESLRRINRAIQP